MKATAVQHDNTRQNPFPAVAKSTITGGAIGYIAKHAIPLTKDEMVDVPYRSIIIATRKDVNKNMVKAINALESKSLAQDTFVKMIDEKNFKNVKNVSEELLKNAPDAVTEFKGIIRTVNSQASQAAKKLTAGFHSAVKCKRPTGAFLIPAAFAGFAVGVISTICNHSPKTALDVEHA